MITALRIVEAAALVLFLLGLFKTSTKGWPSLLEYAMIFVYGLVLEELDMRYFKSYHYGAGYALMIGGVPVCIALLWAVIVRGAMEISDASGIDEAARPFLDGVLAVWIDLAIDAIAIRLGFWHWVIPLHEGWFGVPAGNLYAWMWVAFFYSVLARWVRKLAASDRRWAWAYLAVPFAAYLLLFLELVIIGFAARLFGLVSPNERLWIFFAQLVVFLIVVVANWKERSAGVPLSRFWMASRLTIHLYFIAALFIAGIFRQMPLLTAVTFFVFAGEFVIHARVSHVRN